MSSRAVDLALALPAAEAGRALLDLPEDQWFERKSIRVSPSKLSQAIVALANAEGGTIIVGLSDGVVEGTGADAQHRNELMQAHVQHVHPPARARSRLLGCTRDDGQSDELLVVEVAPGEEVHATTKDDVYLRLGDESRKLSFVQRQELLFDRRQAGYEATPSGRSVDEADAAAAEEYARGLGHPGWRALLDARGLSRDGVLSVAGLLLFGPHPQRDLPAAHLRVSRFAGRERGTGARQQLLSDHRCEGTIPDQIAAAVERVRAVQPLRRALAVGGRFADLPLVPEDAWLEGIVNAAVHRSYSLQGDHVHIDVFDDRIEIESPGRFPGRVDLSSPASVVRFARNPRIARVCSDLHLGQEFGEGIRRMFDEMRLAGLPEPLYRQGPDSVRLVLSGELETRAQDQRLPEETRLVVAALREAGRLGTSDLAEVMGRARPTAIRKLQAMRDQGVVEWVGKSPRDPRAYWCLPR